MPTARLRPSPYHLGATRSIAVVDAAHRTLAVLAGAVVALYAIRLALHATAKGEQGQAEQDRAGEAQDAL